MLLADHVVLLSGGATGAAVCTEIGLDSADEPDASSAATAKV